MLRTREQLCWPGCSGPAAKRRNPSLGTLAAISGALLLSVACKHSTVWFGRADDAAGSSAPAADGGIIQIPDPPPPAADSGTDPPAAVSGRGADPDPEPSDAGAPAAGSGGSAEPPAGDAGAGEVKGPGPGLLAPILPNEYVECPPMANSAASFSGQNAMLWVGKPIANHLAPLLIYWHGTGSDASEVNTMISDARDEIVAEGGIVAALQASTEVGDDTGGPGLWFTGDFEIADQIVACAIQQHQIDPRRIYTAGCSSGGVHAGVMAFARSGYVAAAMTNSGGITTYHPMLQDVSHIPPVIAAHGDPDSDVVIVSFSTASEELVRQITLAGGFAVICNHGGGHCAAPADLKLAQWRFLQAHTYGVQPSPYAASGLPASFPESCSIAWTP